MEQTISRMPGDCDFDINAICKEIALQNSLGNLLTDYKIENSSITLIFK
jgi:hypothetical protein